MIYRDAGLILGYTKEDSRSALECKQHGDCRNNSKSKHCKICEKYWEIMSKCNCVDFDDQVLFACKILENNPDILKKYQIQAEHLLVDEYQDINAAQFKLIEMLSRNSPQGLFAVGDDAQTIYAFRGSDPKYILRFDKDFHKAKTPPLAHSRRCHENIMNDAIKVLKKYYTKWTGEQKLEYHIPSGKEPFIWQLPSDGSEAEMVAKITQYYVKKKNSILILAPKKDFFPLISKKLSEYNVPHDCPTNLLPYQVDKRTSIVKRCLEWLASPADNFLTRLVIEDLINTGFAKVPGAFRTSRTKPETIKNRITAIQKSASYNGSGNARSFGLATLVNVL